MPYIVKSARQRLDDSSDLVAETPGELNYLITTLLNAYLLDHGKRYQTINDIIGALESAKAEFYRRVVAPYEDEKKSLNGDVYL